MDLKSRDHVIDCVSNDFYAIQDEIPKDKCYSSLDHCKECKNETICNKYEIIFINSTSGWL